MSRVKSREYAFRLVFEKFFHEPEDELMFEFDDIVIDEEDKAFVNKITGEININYDNILELIKNNTTGYELERIYKVDLAILYLACAEISYLQTPYKKAGYKARGINGKLPHNIAKSENTCNYRKQGI